MTPPPAQAPRMSGAVCTCRATTYGLMKMPDPMMPPMTIMVASKGPSRRARVAPTLESMAMSKPKEDVRRLLDELPDEASFEDIQYHIYVQEAVQIGLDAAERGELVDQEEIERRMAKWLGIKMIAPAF